VLPEADAGDRLAPADEFREQPVGSD
jgi:hypothetical protein